MAWRMFEAVVVTVVLAVVVLAASWVKVQPAPRAEPKRVPVSCVSFANGAGGGHVCYR